MTSAADETKSGMEMEEIQLAVAEATNNMQSPAEGTGAQSLPAAAQGDEDMDNFSDTSFQVVASAVSMDGSFQVCDHPPNKTLLYRSRMVVVEGGTPAAAQEATTQSQRIPHRPHPQAQLRPVRQQKCL